MTIPDAGRIILASLNRLTDVQPSRKERILEAASEEFARFGYEGGRVARIAERAGVNKQLLFYYFKSKLGLFRAVTASASPLPEPDGAGDGPATEQLRRSVSDVFDALSARPALVASLTAPPDAGAGSHDAAEVIRHLERGIAEVVSTGQGLGYFRDDADPDMVARMGVVLCAGYLALEPRFPDSAARLEWVQAAGESLVRMLAW